RQRCKVLGERSGPCSTAIPGTEENPVDGENRHDEFQLEPKSGLLLAINGESGLVLLIDIKQAKVTGTVSIGSKPEYAAADGKGDVYINVNRGSTGEIVAVDINARKVIKHIRLQGCDEATVI